MTINKLRVSNYMMNIYPTQKYTKKTIFSLVNQLKTFHVIIDKQLNLEICLPFLHR